MLELEGSISRGSFHLQASLSAQPGTITAIIGPSGAGKTSLLHAIAGFCPFEGGLKIDGQDCSAEPPSQRPVSMLFQDHNLFPQMSVFENVALGIDPGLRLNQAARRQVNTILEQLGLSTCAERRPGELSGGQQSRAALARALLRKRPVLLLDEPFAALGPALRAELSDLLRHRMQTHALTVLMVTHQPEDAWRLADQLAVVANHHVMPAQPAKDILQNPDPVLAEYLGNWRPV